MNRAARRTFLIFTRHRSLRQWRATLAIALCVIMSSPSALSHSAVAQGDDQVKPPAETRVVPAQVASQPVATPLEAAAPQEQQEKARDIQGAAQQAPASPATAPEGETQAGPVPGFQGPQANANAVDRGVLFRIYPPRQTTLPAERAAPANTSAEPSPAKPGMPAPAAAATASEPAPSSAPAPAPPPAEPRPSYLLGTIHFGTPAEQGVDYAILEKALAEVDAFVNEADINEAWKPDYDDYRWLAPEQPLSAMISKDSYAMARSLLPSVRDQDLMRMKPWSVLALLEARGETGGDTTMDARLQRIAAGAGKRLVHLETLKEQLQALDCVPATEQALVLDERLRAPWILRDESAAAMNYYRSRNLDAWLADIDHMYGLSYEGRAIEQRSRHCLLEERNARWIGQLETLFQDGPGFVAVGAVHLVGPEGLLAALRRDGYRIEVVPL